MIAKRLVHESSLGCPVLYTMAPLPFLRRCSGPPGAAIVVAMALVLTLAAPTGTRAAGGQYDSHQVKAAFLLNFLKFVSWPGGAPTLDRVDVAVIGADEFASTLEAAVAGHLVGGRPVAVRTIRSIREAGRLPELLFIGESAGQRLPGLLRELEGRPVLTVGDGPGFGASGVVLNFYVSDNRVRFEANTAAAARAGVRISSHLLRLSRIVG